MSRRTPITLLLPLWVTVAAQTAHAQCTPRAVVVGVSIYQDPEFSRLPHAKEDAVAFKEWFETNARCGGGTTSGRPVVRLLTDADAKQTDIKRELSSVLLNAGRNDEVFIFISARGIKTKDYGDGYLIGYDGMRGKLHPSGIGLDILRDILPAPGSRAVRRVFVFADISRDLPQQNEIVAAMQEKLAGNPVLGAVLSAKPRQVSIDAGGGREGLFTHYLVQQLKAAPTRPVSLDQLFQTVRKNVIDASNSKQEPVSFGDSKATIAGWRHERILVASLEPAIAAAEPPPPTPAPFQPSQLDIDRQLAQSFDLEEQAQEVLLRYGEGNHFAGDPLQPGAVDFDAAADRFDRALQNLPPLPLGALDDRLRTSLRARALFCRGGALAYRGRYDDARRILEQARAADPLLPEPPNAIGMTYLEQAQYAAAIDAFQQSIRASPDWAYPRHNLALTYIEMGNNAAAEAAYRAAIQRTPQHPYLYYNLGTLLQRLNRRSEAEGLFEEAVRRFREQAGIYRDRATRLRAESTGDPADGSAADLCDRQAVNVAANEGEAHNALGALWQSERKFARARESFSRALAVNKDLYAARYNLGIIALEERRYAEAAREFETIRQANPNFPMTAQRLACAQTGLQYEQSRDRSEKRRLGDVLKQCSR